MPYLDFITQKYEPIELFNYYFFKTAFTPEEISEIIKLGESKTKEVATVEFNKSNDNIRRSEIAWIENDDESKQIYDRLAEYVLIANREMGWNFDIDGMFEDIQYSIYYDNGGHYNWHTDIGYETPHRKISMSLQLSTEDEYEGGNLQFNLGQTVTTADTNIGSLIIFPSYMLHRVTPVVSGVRRSLVIWVSGKPFR